MILKERYLREIRTGYLRRPRESIERYPRTIIDTPLVILRSPSLSFSQIDV